MNDSNYHLETLATRFDRTDAGVNDAGDVVPPIHLSTTHEMHSPGESEHGYKYTRFGNPTRDVLEERLTEICGAERAVTCASGTAAIAATCLSVVDAGDHVVAFEGIYGGTRLLFEDLLVDSLGATVEYVDATDVDAVDAAVTDETAVVWMETPTNPLLRLCDLAAVGEIATAVDATYVVDNTFATPYFQRPLERGADIVVHSTTKYLNGHSDSMGGAVLTDDHSLADAVKHTQSYVLGGTLGPFDSYLALRGLRTFPLRMDRHETNAGELARYLDDHPSVAHVNYPGLQHHPQHNLAREQMDGFGGIVSFELDATAAETRAVLEALDVFTLAVSLGGTESLVDHPATMSASYLTDTEREAAGISDSLVRLAVGVEHVDDLLTDLDQALENL
ncbi:cystathionine gamma-synthase [Haloferax sp. Atlit-6N]|uniref:Cystathionine synthase/lyase (Cystathionine gamma-synthase, cystathionine gamma-lyase, cystathionine beta-lyase) n=1 Tax=Haloferax gibbonsii TaxID=35746 RepID=A0A871BL05_HALGI|nr:MULTISPECIES: aminotransferase class I/II-fold pyridoxal phosphate-dependent enzyme [Haloferax]QOS13470.1 cystathionine synthase/lyase (cystathionine gamma-synthase, cystathionine gamma-lyase, cystathionine beta-lyase) [Haloferax gibbonsii]REA00565.1 cystathionine gamma-synthase [Haloferax sp. Atlit-6N]